MQLKSWSRRSFALSAALLVALGLVASTSNEASAKHHRKHHRTVRLHNDLLSVAGREGDLSMTVAAYKKAGLAGHLMSRGPWTVFMPSNAGWGKMPKESREGLLNDPKRLAEILKYHNAKGKHDAADLGAKRSIVTLQGESLMLDNKDGTVIVDGCVTTKPDVKASNGIIQVIDYIPIPERGR